MNIYFRNYDASEHKGFINLFFEKFADAQALDTDVPDASLLALPEDSMLFLHLGDWAHVSEWRRKYPHATLIAMSSDPGELNKSSVGSVIGSVDDVFKLGFSAAELCGNSSEPYDSGNRVIQFIERCKNGQEPKDILYLLRPDPYPDVLVAAYLVMLAVNDNALSASEVGTWLDWEEAGRICQERSPDHHFISAEDVFDGNKPRPEFLSAIRICIGGSQN